VQRPDWHAIKTQCVRWAYWGLRAAAAGAAQKENTQKKEASQRYQNI
jgi:hypothetical protein